MTHERPHGLRWRFWLLLAVAGLVSAIPPLWLTGVIRPPRPLFHDRYVTPFNSDRLPHWVQCPQFVDLLGNVCCFDLPRNLMLLDLASERSDGVVNRDSTMRAPRDKQWLRLPFAQVLIPANPRDLLIVTGNDEVIALVSLQEGDAAIVEAWWDELRQDAVQDLIDDIRIPEAIRTALGELRRGNG